MGLSGVTSASAIILLLAAAQTEPKAHTLEDALQVCARIQDPADSLACFKGLAKSAAPASKSPSVTAAPEPAPAPQADGQNGGSRYIVMRADDYRKEQAKAAKPSKPVRQTYDAVVLRAWENANGEYYVSLTNGEVWKNTANENPRPVKDGEKVELRPGSLGSWFMRFKTLERPDIRVEHVE